jgi:thymidylate synthase (FAD)
MSELLTTTPSMLGVKLVNYSQGVPDDNVSTGNLEEFICYCARVSNPSNQMNTETNSRLVKYLMKHHHWSPFEMVSVCMEINVPRDIARQILRHRSFSFQEFSQRYAEPGLGFEMREARLQDRKNRQNSIELEDKESNVIHQQWIEEQKKVVEQSQSAYQWAIENGIAKEQARVVLPEGNTMSRIYMNGTLRSWIHYIELRSAEGTQKEHRIIATECAKAIKPIFPGIMDFVKYDV